MRFPRRVDHCRLGVELAEDGTAPAVAFGGKNGVGS